MARCEEQCSRISTYQLVYTAGGSVPKNFISYSIHEQKTIVHISEEWVNCRDKCFTLLSMSTKSYSMTRSTFSGFRDRHRMRVVSEDKKIGTPCTTPQQQPCFVILNGFECSRLRSRRFRPWAPHSIFHARAKKNTIVPKQQRHAWVSTAHRST